eukprot:CAMPEP_0115519222 /NCGR_PEP_ID=MMETSP0271-20121206/78315_1 /TAXON_ID=71861 /ORGANISM="Scrippsiella trochoidea, Strain CCMP3099" /LENGTH=57 /DNA_ID=CAMNT_0002950207 /DNA_START=1 /DNA_END=171 /DNA_ORIENTATION=+
MRLDLAAARDFPVGQAVACIGLGVAFAVDSLRRAGHVQFSCLLPLRIIMGFVAALQL